MNNHSINENAANFQEKNNTFAFGVMTILFCIWGFITALNDILIPHFKNAFNLSLTQAALVQFCFFGAYFIVSPFAGKLVEKLGYKTGVIAGLSVIALGCIIFYPAAEVEVYGLFLFGLATLAAGVTLLQVSANPYVSILGSESTAASRLNFAQAINSVGHTLGPQFGAILILSTAGVGLASQVDVKAVQLPYLLIAAFVLVVAVVFKFLKLPVIESESKQGEQGSEASLFKQRYLVLGTVAIFLYVGAEVAIGSFLVNFFAQANIANLTEQQAGKMVSYYWGLAMVGRFIGAAIMRFIPAWYVLAFNAAAAILLVVFTIFAEGHVAMWSILLVGLFNSVMFPTIFTMAIRGLGPLTSRGSGLLCQAIVGGALVPVIQGFVADTSSLQFSFIVPACCYIYIFWYAIWGQPKSH